MNIKFKVGDKVKIKNYMNFNQCSKDGVSFVSRMTPYKGCETEIYRVAKEHDCYYYYLEIDNHFWTWSGEWLELSNKWSEVTI